MLAALTFLGASWWWVALAAAVVLVPLAWLALAPAGPTSRTLAVGLALRTLGIGLLVVCLLDPQWTARRAVRGANMFMVVADNSQGLQITDAGAEVTRGAKLVARTTGPASGWLAELSESFQTRAYVFDRELRRVRDFTALDFTGDRSDLAAALERVRESSGRGAAQPLAGVLLFTDGNATDMPDGAPDLSGLPPIYPVVVGDGPVRDVRLERVSVRQTAFDDAPVTLQADLAGHDLAGVNLRVEVTPLGGAGLATSAAKPEAQRVRLRQSEAATPVTFTWRPSGSGVQFYEVAVRHDADVALEEATPLNNRRVAMIDRGRPAFRILYVGGRPSWEFKFLNRALQDDPQLQMVGLLRVARREPKFEFKGRTGESSNPMFRGFQGDPEDAPRYDQPVLVRVNARDETELRGGFPTSAEELYAYDAVILDDVEAAFFRPEQLSLVRQFAAERGGGLLVLGGADSLESGSYQNTALASALPVYLDRHGATIPQGELHWQLTREGWLEPWVRVRATEAEERSRLETMPTLLVSNALESIKPGATVLAQVTDETGKRFPALVAQNFGAGRVACVTVGDLWRWGMKGEVEQADLARFWRQLARWLVTDVPAQVTLRADRLAADGGNVRLLVTARDKNYRPVDLANARLTVRRLDTALDQPAPNNDAMASVGESATPETKPVVPKTERDSGFSAVTLTPEPVPDKPGQFAAVFPGRDAGAYFAEVEVTGADSQVLGRAQTGWVVDSSAEEFHSLAPNRTLLAEIARRTGGEIVPWDGLEQFVATLPERGAPVEEAWSYPIWNTAWVFLAVLACFLAEWGWRRWRGLP